MIDDNTRAVDEEPQLLAKFPPERLLYTTDEAADRLQIGRTTIYRLIQEGALRPVHIGRSCRLSHAELRRYVESLQDRVDDQAAPTGPRPVRSYERQHRPQLTAAGGSVARASAS